MEAKQTNALVVERGDKALRAAALTECSSPPEGQIVAGWLPWRAK